jgi:hypothetical protein
MTARRHSKSSIDRTSLYHLHYSIFDFKQRELRRIPDKRIRNHYTQAIRFSNLVYLNLILAFITLKFNDVMYKHQSFDLNNFLP